MHLYTENSLLVMQHNLKQGQWNGLIPHGKFATFSWTEISLYNLYFIALYIVQTIFNYCTSLVPIHSCEMDKQELLLLFYSRRNWPLRRPHLTELQKYELRSFSAPPPVLGPPHYPLLHPTYSFDCHTNHVRQAAQGTTLIPFLQWILLTPSKNNKLKVTALIWIYKQL